MGSISQSYRHRSARLCLVSFNLSSALGRTYSIKRLKQPDVYAGWSVSDSIRTNSSSGGIFSVLAQAVMREDGKVFAAAFDAGFKLRHREVNGLEDLHAFRGSKYLQKLIGETYQQIACYAKLGVRVMFVELQAKLRDFMAF